MMTLLVLVIIFAIFALNFFQKNKMPPPISAKVSH